MIKQERGITLVSIIIVIAVMTVVASTVVTMSLDRFEINSLRKMFNDIELLQGKVANYYLRYGALPILRDGTNKELTYTYTTLDFNKNSADNATYYILDLEAMKGISLNYGEEGFKNPNESDDVYIINQQSHTVYYVKGIELQGVMHYTLGNIEGIAKDVIPPSTPQIKVISGTKNAKGVYTSEVELELIPGREDGNVAKQTEFSIDNGATWENIVDKLDNNIYKIATTGDHSIKLRSHDKNDNTSEVALDLSVEIRIRKTLEATSTNQSWLDLERSYAGTASQFKIYGNSIQKGTPSPDTPVEVESVGDVVNIFNNALPYKDLTTKITSKEELLEGLAQGQMIFYGIAHNAVGSEITYNRVNTTYIVVPIENNKTYIMNNYKKDTNNMMLLDENFIQLEVSSSTNTITNSVGAKYLFVYVSNSVHVEDGRQTWTLQDILDNLQIEEGTTTTEYTPYGKYRIPVKVSGKNLADPQNLINSGFTKQEDGSYYVEKSSLPKDKILYDNIDNKTGSFSISYSTKFELGDNNGVGCFIRIYYTDGTKYDFDVITLRPTEYVEDTYTTPSNKIVDYVTWTYGTSSAKTYVKDVQIEYGDTVTDYEPYQGQTFNIYLDQPLRKLGDYSDYIDFSTGKVVRNIGRTVLSGSNMTWYSYNDNQENVLGFYTSDLPSKSGETRKYSLSNRFVRTDSDIAAGGILGVNYETFYIVNSYFKIAVSKERISEEGVSNLDTFKNWLDKNDVYIEYILATQDDTETIELPELKLFDEYTTIEVLTEVPPSEIYAEYEGYEFQ